MVQAAYPYSRSIGWCICEFNASIFNHWPIIRYSGLVGHQQQQGNKFFLNRKTEGASEKFLKKSVPYLSLDLPVLSNYCIWNLSSDPVSLKQVGLWIFFFKSVPYLSLDLPVLSNYCIWNLSSNPVSLKQVYLIFLLLSWIQTRKWFLKFTITQ